ncbi:MAG: DM13 domain-containing protein [Burkholderiaceae bacterium]|nr:DM13 domain-containing protein [Burkholderiaceae bacterium]
MVRFVWLLISHSVVAAVAFAAGIYVLPILIAPAPPTDSQLAELASTAQFKGEFRRDLEGSDALHWGEGTIMVSARAVALKGRIAPGPDYKLYLAPEFVRNKEEFVRLKSKMARVGDVKTFENFVVAIPESVDPGKYNTAIVWCESFGQFITAGKYR